LGVVHECICTHSKTDHLSGHRKKEDGSYTTAPHDGPCQWFDCNCSHYVFGKFDNRNAGRGTAYLEPMIIRTLEKKPRRKNGKHYLRMADLNSEGKPKEIDIAMYTCRKCGVTIKNSHRGAHMKNHKKQELLLKVHAS